MDASVAISAHGLSKRFRLGQTVWWYRRLQDTISTSMSHLVRGGPRADFLWAVRDVSFDVTAGEVFGVIGRNGAGKSVLFSMLSRIIRPTKGSAEVKGRLAALIDVGTGFHPELTGRENVYLNGAILGMTRAEITRKFDDIIAFSGLEPFVDTPVKRYSSGMRVRLGFSVAAYLEPDVLLLDEILAVGDASFVERCNARMAEIAGGGTTILFVSHHLDEVRRLCDRVLWLDQGQIVQIGDPVEVIDAYAKRFASADTEVVEGRFVKFSGWHVADGGSGPHVVATDRGVCFVFDVYARRPLPFAEFGVALDDQDHVTMGEWSGSISLDEGPNTVTVEFPSWPVTPGMYHLRLMIGRRHGGHDVFNCVPPLTVVSESQPGLSERRIGVLNVPATFDVDPS